MTGTQSSPAGHAETEQQEQPAPPPTPRRAHERAALAALDLLRSLAPSDAPLPRDRGVLRFLAHHSRAEAPGLATPDWLVEACAARGLVPADDDFWHTAPTIAQLRDEPPQTWGSSAMHIEHAYTQGILSSDDLLGLLPAHRLLLLPHDWRRLAFADAWRRALARLLRAELGGDADAWLRLAATAVKAGGPDGHPDTNGPSWPDLLRTARSASGPGKVGNTGSGALEEAAWATHTARPRTPDEALGLLAHGNHLWAWPAGTLLCLAEADVVDAVLPRLGPDGPWLLAAFLLRHDRTPRPAFGRLLAGRDPRALRILAAESRWLEDGLIGRLADIDDPDTDLALLRHAHDPLVTHRIVARSRRSPGADPVAARVLAELRTGQSPWPIGGVRWLCSAEPDLIEEILVRRAADLSFVHQAFGCLALLEHAGAARLATLVGRGVLGPAAAKLCAKALASGDPAAVLRARVDRELAPAKLVNKLRRCRHRWEATRAVAAVPADVDWAAIEAAHAAEPLPHWADLVGMTTAPADLRLRHAASVREPGPDGLPDGADLTRARARHGLAGMYHCPPATQIDGLLASGMLDGSDLVQEAAPAALVLAYLGSAARRDDAPAEAAAALAEVAGVVRSRLGTDPERWTRVTDRLTGRDPRWEPMSPVAALLS
ncbi:hypothetical protein [Streptomyces sp. NPDC049040]|uniref:hypothetical protein n=1 Tax=Streptomyces sp. NPDC049040 TaxID=3365593 RepID=UPI00371417C1